MPYRNANWWVGLTFIVIVAGFWDSYFQPPSAIPLAFHVHAITALLWVGLLMLQHWSIHHQHRKLHRFAGQSSLLLFPFLMVGFMMIINVSASSYAAGESAFAQVMGPSFGLTMILSMGTYAFLYFQALRYRRRVRLHAGYLLATPIVLFESPFSRVVGDLAPGIYSYMSPGPAGILDVIALSMLASAMFALIVYSRLERDGAPFLFTGVLMVVHALSMRIGTEIPGMGEAFAAYATLPPSLTLGFAFVLGALTAWAGWVAPQRPKVPPSVLQPA